MGKHIEYGVGVATCGTGIELGRRATSDALSQIKRFSPTLALAFISAQTEVSQVHFGIVDILGDCPLLGTSTAGEISNASLLNTVVVVILASPHMWVHVGMGNNVSKDYRKATNDALSRANIQDYFKPGHYLNHMLNLSAPGSPAAPMMMILFTPGSTFIQYSLSHEIHTLLRKGSMNRIPIFGGSSGDYFQYRSNFQIANQQVATDSVALALVESEVLFGLGMTHGFTRSRNHAVITRSEGHTVYEIDGIPAAEAFADMLNIDLNRLGATQTSLSNHPFALHDIYGNSILLVPERLLNDGSIQFAPMMRNNQVITQMTYEADYIKKSCYRAFQKAVWQGGIQEPYVSLLFVCALRKNIMADRADDEITHLKEQSDIPFHGFYSFGEQGLSNDGFPIYSNQSVSALVFSDELNPTATLIHSRKKIYSDFKSQLDAKVSQVKLIKQMGKIVHTSESVSSLLPLLINELKNLLPWADAAFYLPRDQKRDEYSIASASNFERFKETIRARDLADEKLLIWLGNKDNHFGVLVLKGISIHNDPSEEDLLMAEIVGQLTAGGCKKFDVNSRLQIKLNHIEILNRLGHELAHSMATDGRYQTIIKHIRETLNLSIASLWLTDRSVNLLIKEALDTEENISVGSEELRTDEKIACWQMKNCKPYFWLKEDSNVNEIGIDASFHLSFISLPILHFDELRGVLNLYSRSHYRWYFQKHYMAENIDFLKGVSGQLAVFIENRALHQQKTLNKEIHHRVKNNLQNIASLLRMQARRVDNRDAQKALEGSISRIMSIAMVHQTLSSEDIEKVNIGNLVDRISTLATNDMGKKPTVTLDVDDPLTMLPSKFATSLALILNELIINAIKYGRKSNDEATVDIKIIRKNNFIYISVEDNGPGFPEGFNVDRDANLGLTIVSTLIKDELKGDFSLESSDGARATLVLPLPGVQQLNERKEHHEFQDTYRG